VSQLLTDRFAQTNDGNYAPCTNLSDYCGGTFQGMYYCQCSNLWWWRLLVGWLGRERTCGSGGACWLTFRAGFLSCQQPGIVNHLDYIQGMGFDAIWISPIVTNTPGGYHGYWSKDLYGINPYFGTADDLRQLINVR
jgi:glycosidase